MGSDDIILSTLTPSTAPQSALFYSADLFRVIRGFVIHFRYPRVVRSRSLRAGRRVATSWAVILCHAGFQQGSPPYGQVHEKAH